MAVPHFTDQDFEAKVLKAKGLFFIDFYADWCGPCKMAEPIINDLADNKYKGKLTMAKVDVDANQTTSQKYGIMSIPTVVMFRDGKEIDRMSGFAGEEGYVKLIEKALGK